MWFKELTVNDGLSGSFTIAYSFTDGEIDEWTRRIRKFKDEKMLAVERVINLMSNVIPHLVQELGLDARNTAIIPGLSSNEKNASPNGVLWRISEISAKAASIKFVPDAICKDAHESLHKKTTNLMQRKNTIKEANYRSEIIELENILILDDLITSGTTMSYVARAIRASNEKIKNVYAIALGKNEKRSICPEGISNSHVPPEYEIYW